MKNSTPRNSKNKTQPHKSGCVLDIGVIESFKKIRKEKGITQGQLAKLVDTKQSAISRFESGRYNPTVDFLEEFAKALSANLEVGVEGFKPLDHADLFKKIRKEKGITQGQLAKLVDTKQSAISRFESGRYNPSVLFLREITDALNVKLNISVNRYHG